MALNILTGSKLVVKRIASKETKNPRVPVDGDALVAEVRFRTPRARAEALRGFFFFFVSASARPSTPRAPLFVRSAFAANDEILSPESMRLLLN